MGKQLIIQFNDTRSQIILECSLGYLVELN